MTPHDAPTSRLAPVFGAALFALMVAAIAVYALRNGTTPWGGTEECEQPGDGPPTSYEKWDKPLVALVLSGQMHGYVDPCGCSHPQYGGLVRRYNFVQSLVTGSATKGKQRWDVVGIDLGEFAQHKGIQEQNILKFRLTVQSLAKSNYRAFGIGADEVVMPLGDALAQVWDKKVPHPRPTSLSLGETAPGKLFHDLNVRAWEIIDHTTPRIGVINILGPDLTAKLKGAEPFVDAKNELPKALQAFADAGVEFGVILHHEYPMLDPVKFPAGGFNWLQQMEAERRARVLEWARTCHDMRQKNKKIPPIYLTMVLTAISDPSFVMTELDPKLPTKVVEIGHKGKYVGLLGVYRDKQQRLQMQYQTVLMDPALDPAEKDKPAHPIVNLFETYTQDLKRQDVMSKYPRTVHLNQLVGQNQKGLKARYIGSERCGDCHDHAYKVWKDWKDPKGKVNGHAFATETLEHVKFPSNRNFDPECMRCHTTGMQHATGYNDYVPNLALWPMKQEVARKKLDQHNQSLRGVGCESCHGPGSEHEKAPNNKAIYEFINPYGLTAEERLLEPLGKNRTPEQEKRYQALFQPRMGALNAFCFKCHDEENDVHWGKAGHKIEDMWIGKKLIHRTPPPAKNNGPVIIQPRQPRGDAIDDRKK